MSTTTRVEQFVKQFEAVNDELITLVEGCTEEQWRGPCLNEGRSVAVVAHHVALVHGGFTGLVDRLAGRETYSPSISLADVDEINAKHARDNAAVSTSETLDLMRTNGAVLAERLHNISDDQLDHTAGEFGGNELSVTQVIEYIIIGHPASHLASIRATLAG